MDDSVWLPADKESMGAIFDIAIDAIVMSGQLYGVHPTDFAKVIKMASENSDIVMEAMASSEKPS